MLDRAVEQLTAPVRLLTGLESLLRRVVVAVEAMRASVARLEMLAEPAADLLPDARQRMVELDERVHREMDEAKRLLLERVGQLDDLLERFERVEASLANIERATVQLQRSVSGAIEALPDRLTERVRRSIPRGAVAPPVETDANR